MQTLAEWCGHYGYELTDPKAKADYQRYLSGLDLFGQLVESAPAPAPAEADDDDDDQGPVIRQKIIKIRVSAEEHERLKQRCTKAQLAEWMRETCLTGQRDLVAEQKQADPVDPALLRALAGVGNNMNQIARAVNSGSWGPADTVAVIKALKGVEDRLTEIRRGLL